MVLLDQERSFQIGVFTCILPVLSKYSKVVVSTEGSHQSKLGLVARRVRIIVLVHNNIHMRLTRLQLFVLLFNFVSLLDTLYIHFSVVVAWAVHGLLTELSA